MACDKIGTAYGFSEDLRALGDAFVAEATPLAEQFTPLNLRDENDETLHPVPGPEQWMMWCHAIIVDEPTRTRATDICDVYRALMNAYDTFESARYSWQRAGRLDVADLCMFYAGICCKYAMKVTDLIPLK